MSFIQNRPVSRGGRFALALAVMALAGACATGGALRQARSAEQARDFDLAVAHYSRAVHADPDNREARAGLERAKLRAAEAHLGRGRRLFSQGKYDDAVVELQVAYELSPASDVIEADLRAARAAQRTKLAAPAEGQTVLESVLTRARSLTPPGLDLPDVPLPSGIETGAASTSRQVYQMLAKLAGLSLVFDAQFVDAPVSITLKDPTIRQALDTVAQNTRSFYKVTGPKTITVIPDTPAKRREYTEEHVRTFFVSNLDMKEVVDLLRVVADIRQIQPVSTNTFTIRDTPERLDAVSKLLAAIDKAKAEVIVDVEILEVDRTSMREYGLQIASPGVPGAPNSAGIDGAAGVDQPLTLRSLRNLTQSDILMSGVPALYYRLLKTDSNTRTLANPHIRMVDGVLGRAEMGERVPIPTSQIVPLGQGGNSLQSIQNVTYENIGINVDVTPRFHANNDVTLSVKLVMSTVSGTGFAGYPTFGNRSVTSTVRLRDGETNIIAGLIRDSERTVAHGIPGISNVPLLGRLFGRNKRETQETDIVLTLTPHIVRVLELRDEDLRPFRIRTDGSGILPVELTPIGPPRDIIIK
jgi:general secretion pathway protein D